ncbi:RDD family protein [Pelomonas sp. SE-A7]|uniref:RDD family protein n=1 Tax=Pelomonas sp. SE-A7 TaxID=3054953 RepID=UPI00259D1524|nr:RDD family protein [Pelomonas sp. SE-A7]MDM4766087.1 RDD family protein [Pelomonas sp. SE-A7]
MSAAPPDEVRYAGFWLRLGASIIDSALLWLVLGPILLLFGRQADYEFIGTLASLKDQAIDLLVGAALALLCWLRFQGTPGKLLLGLRVVDAQSRQTLKLRQAILRYLGYLLAMLPLCLGFVWIAFDKRKQGWQDKLAGSVVIHAPMEKRRSRGRRRSSGSSGSGIRP